LLRIIRTFIDSIDQVSLIAFACFAGKASHISRSLYKYFPVSPAKDIHPVHGEVFLLSVDFFGHDYPL